jgi:hypothetical protein
VGGHRWVLLQVFLEVPVVPFRDYVQFAFGLGDTNYVLNKFIIFQSNWLGGKMGYLNWENSSTTSSNM